MAWLRFENLKVLDKLGAFDLQILNGEAPRLSTVPEDHLNC